MLTLTFMFLSQINVSMKYTSFLETCINTSNYKCLTSLTELRQVYHHLEAL